MKITMLGRSSSGKTTYMSALYDVLGDNSVRGFHIQPTAHTYPDSILKLGQFADISFFNRGLIFPDGTVQTTVWTFDLFYYDRLAASFEWIDYRGGLLDNVLEGDAGSNGQRSNQFHDLLTHISQSEAIIVFLDSIVLTHTKNPTLRKRQSGASAVSVLLRNFAIFFPNRPLNLVIVLTKADSDLIPEQWKANNYKMLLDLGRSLFADVVVKCHGEGVPWSAAIAPVGAIGSGNVSSTATMSENPLVPLTVQTSITNYPEPFNVAETLFYCIGQTLASMERRARTSLAHEQLIIETAMEKSEGFARAFSVLTGHRDPKRIAHEAQQRRQRDFKLIVQIREHVQEIQRVAARTVFPL